jgi:tRNA threonylcarbamoyladenosine biosynthesis protein TsaB
MSKISNFLFVYSTATLLTMKILAIEHSTATGSIALLEGDNILQEISWQRAAREPSTLTVQISQILKQQNIILPEIDIFTVGLGPGIYSNMRISLSAANGLALPDKKPVYGISSAAALAYAHTQQHGLKKIIIIGDARRNRVWYAPFTINNGQLQDQQPYDLITIDELPTHLTTGDTIISPDWIRLEKPLTGIKMPDITIIRQNAIPKASIIGQLTQKKIEQKIKPAFPVTPIYIHPPVFVKPRFPLTKAE